MNSEGNKQKVSFVSILLAGNLLLLSVVLGVIVLHMLRLSSNLANNRKNINQLQLTRPDKCNSLVDSVDRLIQLNQKSLAHLIRSHRAPPGIIQKPIQLKKAYILPHPPYNRGRLITYESLEKQTRRGGLRVVVFQERRGQELIRTEIPENEIKWEVK